MKVIKIKKQKWEYFSEQEIINILTNSKSYKEALLAFGYKATDSTMNYKIRELSEKFNVSLSHFTKTGTLIGQKFGMLQVIEESKKRSLSGDKYYKCQCECSNNTIVEVLANHLRRGHTQSCGCSRSHGEILIAKVLEQLNIEFIKEYSFKDLKSISGVKLRFDFFLPLYNTIIEYQGRQHYEDVGGVFGGKEKFKRQIMNDSLKRNYCKNKEIKLIEIPYTDLSKINTSYLQERIIK